MATLQQLIDSVPHFIAFVDREERYQVVNRNHEEWFQLPREKIIGRRLSEIHRPSTYETMVPRIRSVLAGETVLFDFPLTGRDGQSYHFDVRYIPRFNGAGEVAGFFVLALDVTHRQRAEVRLRRNAQLLEDAMREQKQLEEQFRQ